MIYINQLFLNISNQIRKFYLNSNLYDKKISKVFHKNLIYKPSPHLLSSLIKYQKKKFHIKDFFLENIWNTDNINENDYKNLNSFYWFFSLDLKSPKETVHSVISKWIKKNFRYNKKVGNLILLQKE